MLKVSKDVDVIEDRHSLNISAGQIKWNTLVANNKRDFDVVTATSHWDDPIVNSTKRKNVGAEAVNFFN